MIKYQKFLYLLIIICNTSFADTKPITRNDFIIKIGTMEFLSSGKDKFVESQKVTMDPSRIPGFCFIIDPPSNTPYTVYSVHYLPGTPTILTGDFKDKALKSSITGIKTDIIKSEGIRPFCFDFHKGDPIGTYRIEVFINNTLKNTFNLDVLKK